MKIYENISKFGLKEMKGSECENTEKVKKFNVK